MTMLAPSAKKRFSLLSMKDLMENRSGAALPTESSARAVAAWVKTYLMSAHPDLGRVGDVCPFTAQASRLDTIRIGASEAGAADENLIEAQLRESFRQFDEITCPKSMRHFRTILIAFPNCDDEGGRVALRNVQAKLKFFSLGRAKMLGLFHSDTDAPGLWNQDFRPLRSPLPIMAIRNMVVNDAPFALRHPLLLPVYLAKFPFGGARRLMAQVMARG
jgi:hypothetical protein